MAKQQRLTFDRAKHPRQPKGHPRGGQFAPQHRLAAASQPVPGVVSFASGASAVADLEGFARARHPVGVVASELTEPAKRKLVQTLDAGNLVFVDSGAFTGYTKGRPVSFPAVLATYQDIAQRTKRPGNLYVVAPDQVGDQAQSLALQREHAGELRSLARRGVRVLLPIQRGPQAPSKVFGELTKLMRTPHFGVAVPANKEAFDGHELADLARAQPRHIHFLGVGWRPGALRSIANGVRVYAPQATITSDANRLRAWTGQRRALTRGSRELAEPVEVAGRAGRLPALGWDDTELPAAAAEGALTQGEYRTFADMLQLPVADVLAAVREGRFLRYMVEYGDWADQALLQAVAARRARESRAEGRSRTIAALAGGEDE